MKAAYIFTRFPVPSETFACNDVRALKGLGVDISVYTLRGARPDAERMLEERGLSGVPITHSGTWQAAAGCAIALSHPLLLLRLIWWVTKNDLSRFAHWLKCVALIPSSFFVLGRLERERPDVIHLFWGHYPSLVGYLVKARLPRSRLSMFLGAYDLEMGLGISADLADRADHLFTHAEVNLKRLEAMGIERADAHVVHRGVDVEMIESIDGEFPGCKGHFPVVSCVARLFERKGVRDAVRAIPLLEEAYPRIRLFVAGEGPSERSLSSEAGSLGLSDQVIFLGHIPHSEAIRLLKSTDIFVLPSRHAAERLPNVVKEAMLCGAVTVTTKSPGIEELISRGVDGVLLDSGEPEQIARAIADVLEDEDGMRSMLELARRKVIDGFSLTVQMQRYISIWHEE
mgnify:CR=1 FL=1